jgi:hypothetical protein
MSTLRANVILDAAGGNTATINGITPTSTSGVLSTFNAAGSAPVYACRAWVNFNGGVTPTIRASGNVSSVTRTSAGLYTVNFATAMQDTNYAFFGGNGDYSSGTALLYTSERTGRTASAVPIVTGYINTGAAGIQDNTINTVAIFR